MAPVIQLLPIKCECVNDEIESAAVLVVTIQSAG